MLFEMWRRELLDEEPVKDADAFTQDAQETPWVAKEMKTATVVLSTHPSQPPRTWAFLFFFQNRNLDWEMKEGLKCHAGSCSLPDQTEDRAPGVPKN